MRRDVFQAIADPTRRAIIELIALQAMTPHELAAQFDMSRQALSKHLRILTECQVTASIPSGRENRYHLVPQHLQEVADFVEPFRRMWELKHQQLNSVLQHLVGDADDQI